MHWLPYWIVYVLFLVLSIPVVLRNKAGITNLPENYIVLCVLVLFFCFRAFVFDDWMSYYLFYLNVPSLSSFTGIGSLFKYLNDRSFELGFVFYAIICKTISSNYFFFQAISSLIDIIILYQFFKRYLRDKVIMGFAFFCLFYGFSMEIQLMRNSKAIMLFLISLKYIKERKMFYYMVINFIGFLFHLSSIVFFPLYFILNKQIPKILLISLFVMGNICFFLGIKWVFMVLDIIIEIIPDFKIAQKIYYYTNSESYSAAIGLSIGYLERSCTFILITVFSTTLVKKDRDSIIFINLMYIYLFVYLFFYEMWIFIDRFTVLFGGAYWVLYPKVYKILTKEKKYLFMCILFLYGSLKLAQGISYHYDYDHLLFGETNYSQRLREHVIRKQINDREKLQ